MSGQITSVVLDTNTGNALQGVIIRTYTQSTLIDTQTTDVTGNFTTGVLNEGFYNILVSREGYNQLKYQNIKVSSDVILSAMFLQPVSTNNNLYGQKSDSTWQPIISNDKNSLVSTTQSEKYSRIGCLYGASTGTVSVSANGFLALQLTNPTGSGKSLHLNRTIGGATTNTTIDLIRNATFSATGTAITPRNRNFGYPDSSIATVKWITQATDPTTGGQLLTSIIQTAGQEEVDYNGEWIMPTNSTLIVRLINNTNQINPLSIGLSWWEEIL